MRDELIAVFGFEAVDLRSILVQEAQASGPHARTSTENGHDRAQRNAVAADADRGVRVRIQRDKRGGGQSEHGDRLIVLKCERQVGDAGGSALRCLQRSRRW